MSKHNIKVRVFADFVIVFQNSNISKFILKNKQNIRVDKEAGLHKYT